MVFQMIWEEILIDNNLALLMLSCDIRNYNQFRIMLKLANHIRFQKIEYSTKNVMYTNTHKHTYIHTYLLGYKQTNTLVI